MAKIQICIIIKTYHKNDLLAFSDYIAGFLLWNFLWTYHFNWK